MSASRPADRPTQSSAARVVQADRPAIWMVVSAVLIVALIAVAAYLTYVHYQPQALVCAVDGGCHTVQSSRYATLGPVPIAVLGLGMAVVLLAMMVLRWRRPDLAPVISIAMVGMLVGAVAYYGYLTHIELNVLDAICQWCVLSAVLTVALLVTEGIGFWRQLSDLADG